MFYQDITKASGTTKINFNHQTGLVRCFSNEIISQKYEKRERPNFFFPFHNLRWRQYSFFCLAIFKGVEKVKSKARVNVNVSLGFYARSQHSCSICYSMLYSILQHVAVLQGHIISQHIFIVNNHFLRVKTCGLLLRHLFNRSPGT